MMSYREKFLLIASNISNDTDSTVSHLEMGAGVVLSIDSVPIEDIYMINLYLLGLEYQLNSFGVTKDELSNKKEMEVYFDLALKEIIFINTNLEILIGDMRD